MLLEIAKPACLVAKVTGVTWRLRIRLDTNVVSSKHFGYEYVN